MTDTPNQQAVPAPVNQKLTNCPACGKDIIARVYLTFTIGTNINFDEGTFTTIANLVGLSVAHDCSPKVRRGLEGE